MAGLALEKYVDNHFRLLNVVAVFLIVFGLILLAAERVGKQNETLNQLTFKQSLLIGLAQAFALVPGASRSGCTISAGLFVGLKREDAARFSFLLSIPAITLAGLYKLQKAVRTEGLHGELGKYLLAALVACLFAYIAVQWFMKFVEQHDTRGFVAYRIVLGIVLLVLVRQGVVHNRYKPVQEKQPTSGQTAQRTLSIKHMVQRATNAPVIPRTS